MPGEPYDAETIRPDDPVQPRGRRILEQALPAYEIGETLGRGAQAVVVAARHRRLGRAVAVKLLAPSLRFDDTIRARFETEAQLLAALDHPHIVRIFDFIETDAAYLLIMERLGGGTVRTRLGPHGLEPPQACAIVLAACSALHYAHGKGVLHRDVKPENLLFSATGALKVGDFGIAKVLGAATGLTRTGLLVGTPAYIAPEQIDGRAIGPHTDVYATGTVLYELLCGTLPFAATNDLVEAFRRRTEGPPPPLNEQRPAVPEAVAEVVSRALAPDPSGRYATAAVLAEALQRAATGAWGRDWATASGVVVHSAPTKV